MSPTSAYWDALAARYHAMPPPLVPSAEDLQLYTAPLRKQINDSAPLRVLVLGATPAFCDMRWPAGTDLLAVDRSAAMLRAVWPGSPEGSRCEDWTALSLDDASRDIALCDGGLSFVRYPDQLEQVASALHRVLAADGLFIVRLYTGSAERIGLPQLAAQLRQGSLRNSSELKLYLWMALSQHTASVKLHDAWASLYDCCPDFEGLARAAGWPQTEIDAMNAYQNQNDVYYFPTPAQVRAIFCDTPGGFRFESLEFGTTPLAQFGPILVLRRI